METQQSAGTSQKMMRYLPLAALILATGTVGFAQLIPSQLPPGPPPAPGELGPAPVKLPPGSSATGPDVNVPVPQVSGDDNDATFRSTIRYVLVPTSVLDPDGHGYVNGLNANNFEIYDNDKPQKVVAEFTQLPLSMVLVVQANSEIEPMLPKLKKTGLLLHGLVTGDNGDIAVLAFDHRLQHLQDFTKNPDELDDAMQKLSAGSNSARLVDAVWEADHMLVRHDPRNTRRRVILLLSRNVDKGSEGHLHEAVRRMEFDNVVVYSVDISRFLSSLLKQPGYPRPQNGGIPPSALPNIAGGQGPLSETSVIQQENGNALNAIPPIYRGIKDLFTKSPAEAFAYFTGGREYSFARERALENAISDIGADLNSQYLLSYSPTEATRTEPGFHSIKVTVDRPGLKIRTRPGYWWGGGVQ